MAKGLNRLELIGHLGRDPNTRYTPAGKAVSDFSLAVNDFQDKATWFKVVTWEKTAEFAARYLSKGQLVYVAGPVTMETWQGSDGQPRAQLAVTARELQLLDGGHRDDAPAASGDDVDAGDLAEELPAGLVTHGPGTRRPAKEKTSPPGPAPLGTKPGDEDFEVPF